MCISHLCIADNPVFDICKKQICDVILDAGYTGTRVHVYALTPQTFNQDKKLIQIYEKKVKKSFANIAPQETYQLFDELFSEFPKFRLDTYVYATESYRSLTYTKQKEFSRYIRRWFRTKPNLNLREVRNLSGQEEAFFAWLSNYFMHYTQLKDKSSIGTIEIGGGSAQIAVNYQGISSCSEIHNINRLNGFDGKVIQLWVKSLHSFGREKMSRDLNCHAPVSIDNCVQQISAKASIEENHDVKEIQNIIKQQPRYTIWYGLGLLSYVGNSPLYHFNGSYTLNQLLTSGQHQACQIAPEILNEKKDPFAQKTCFNSAYIYTLTHKFIGLPQDTVIHYDTREEGQGWPQGIMIKRYIAY